MRKIVYLALVMSCLVNLNAQEEHIIESGKAKLFVKLYPKPGAETILLLHGGPGAPTNFTDEINHLKEKYQLINFDQRGAGNSTCKKCEYTLDEYVMDIRNIIQHFSLGKAHLFGHSWGGLYAQIFAQAHPEMVASLFLSSPSPGTGKHWSEMKREVMLYNKQKCTKKEWRRMGLNSMLGALGSDKAMGRLYMQVVKNYNKGYVEIEDNKSASYEKAKGKSTHKTVKNIKNAPLLKKLSSPDFPILITYGDDDIYGETTKYVIERYPTAKVVFIPNCGHLPTIHNPEKYWELFASFYRLGE